MSSISPLDGRYKKDVQELNEYFSEQALMRFRLYVEIKYLIFLPSGIVLLVLWLTGIYLVLLPYQKKWQKQDTNES